MPAPPSPSSSGPVGVHRGRHLRGLFVGGSDRAGGAGYIGNLYRGTQGFPDSVGRPMRQTLKEYAERVIDKEWPVQQKGQLPSAGWAPLYKLHGQLVRYEPKTRGEAVVEAEFLRTLNQLYQMREERLTAAAGHIPVVIW